MVFAFFNLGFGEIFAIFVVVLLLFGADKIPEFARSLGKGIRYVKDATDSVKRDIQTSVDEVKTDIDANVKDVKKDFESVTNVKRKVRKQVNDVVEDVRSSVDEVATEFDARSMPKSSRKKQPDLTSPVSSSEPKESNKS